MENGNAWVALGKVFSELTKAYANAFTERLEKLPIKRYYYALLVIETHEDTLNQTVLADELYMDKAAVVRMLDYLEAEGCIKRKQNPKDRREHLLQLTPKALKMIPEIKQALHEVNAICLEQAAAHGITNLEAALNDIRASLQPEAGGKYQIHFVNSEENN